MPAPIVVAGTTAGRPRVLIFVMNSPPVGMMPRGMNSTTSRRIAPSMILLIDPLNAGWVFSHSVSGSMISAPSTAPLIEPYPPRNTMSTRVRSNSGLKPVCGSTWLM